MKEDIRQIEIQLPEDSEIIEALIASRNKEENIDNIEILLYLGKRKKPLKIILRPRGESLDFDVTTPLYHFHPEMKEEAHIGKAQISKALPIDAPIKSNLTDLYSLSIEMVEKPTDSTESFIKRIKVLKDELAVAKETLRLTGDIFHILPNAKKRFNIVKNKTKLEHFYFSELDPLVQKENNPLSLYLDVPVAKSILLPEILKDLKKWKNILSLETIDISLDDLKIGHVSKFVYRAHSPRGNDCTYELIAKCVINNSDVSNRIKYTNLLGPTIKYAAVKSLENAYLNYNKKKRKKEDKQTISIDMSLNPVEELEKFSHLVNEYSNFPFMVSTDNEQAARIIYSADTEAEAVNLIMNIKEKLKNRFIENRSKQSNFSIYDNYINIETKTFSSDNTILKVQDVVLVGSKDLGKYFVVAKLQ